MGLAAGIGALGGAILGKKASAPQQTTSNSATNGVQSGSQSGGTEGTFNTTTNPLAAAQPGLNSLYAGALNAYDSGGPQYYPGQTLADQSWSTRQGLAMDQARALQGGASFGGAGVLDAAQNLAQRTAQGQMFDSNPATSALENASNFNPNAMQGQAGLAQFGQGAYGGRTAGDQGLAQVAGGAYLNSNPYVDSMFNQAAGQVNQNFTKNVMPSMLSGFEGAGRYGSEAMNNGIQNVQQGYGNQMNQLATQIYGGNYANERNLQQQAMNQQGNIGIQERQQQLAGLGQQTGNQLQGQGLDLQALNTLTANHQNERQLQSQAMGMAPGLSAADYTDINAQMAGGATQDAYAQQQANAAKAAWDYQQNLPNNNLLNLANIMQTAAPYAGKSGTTSGTSYGNSSGTSFGNTVGTQTSPGNPMAPLNGIFGGAMMGSALMNPTGMFGY